jgi:putative ABC transport system substrate-binding protein
MRRREFIAMAACALALPCEADTTAVKRVGVILQGAPYLAGVEGLREALKTAGLEEGRDLALVVRDAAGDPSAVEAAARELENDGVDLIVAFSTSTALATKRATARVPIVFSVSSDPVAVGLVESISHPGGRLTGAHNITSDLTGKRLQLLRDLVPGVRRVLTFYNPANPAGVISVGLAREAAGRLGIEFVERQVASAGQVRDEAKSLRAGDADAYFFVSDAMATTQERLIVARANELRMATMASWVDPVLHGTLAAYGISLRQIGRGAANYVSRILAGTPPGDLPVEAVNRPVFAINLKTAQALGITVAPTLLAQADEVIE